MSHVDGVAIAPGYVFVSDGQHNGVTRLETTALDVSGGHRIGNGAPLSLAYGAGSLWTIDGTTNRLLRVNPKTWQIVHVTTVRGLPQAVAFGHDNVWVTTVQSLPNHMARRMLERVDPTTGEVTGHTVLTGTQDGEEIVIGNVVAVAGWLGPNIQLIDPTTMRIVRTISGRASWPRDVPNDLTGPPRLTSLKGAIYMLTGNDTIVRLSTDGPEPTVFLKTTAARFHINPRTYLTSADGLLWVLGSDRFYGIDPALGRITAVAPAPKGGWVVGQARKAFLGGIVAVTRRGHEYTLYRLARNSLGAAGSFLPRRG
jgi:hypothetical protein